MVEDLTLHGVSEPYRMLTARAEYRLRLRANNASTRLTPLALDVGCVGPERARWFERRQGQRARWADALSQELGAADLARHGVPVRAGTPRQSLAQWLRFPDVELAALRPWLEPDLDPGDDVAAEVAEDCAYAPYLERQDRELRDLRASAAVHLPPDFSFADVPGLSNEMVERLTAASPETLAAASLVRGVTPAALAALLVHARRHALATA
jgi:tRNA uridine 5-carboxymethylaminomethyl modification enzyme